MRIQLQVGNQAYPIATQNLAVRTLVAKIENKYTEREVLEGNMKKVIKKKKKNNSNGHILIGSEDSAPN